MCVKRSAWRAVFLTILAAGLVSCGPEVTPQPLPTPQILEVQVSPALLVLEPDLYECARQESLALILSEEADLRLRWGPLPGWEGYAAVLGQEPWDVIVHPENDLDQINRDVLRSIYAGQMRDWQLAGAPLGQASPIHAWSYAPESDLQLAFESSGLGQDLPGGKTFLAPDPEAMLTSVAQDPGAVGFLPRRWINESVKVVTVDGSLDGAGSLPILALSPTPPQEPEDGWLLCLQERLAVEEE
jgi:hypothetical protein